MLASLFFSWVLSPWFASNCLLIVSSHGLAFSLCLPTPGVSFSSCMDTSPIELGPHLMTSFPCNCLLTGPISKNSQQWEWGLQPMNFGRDTIQSITRNSYFMGHLGLSLEVLFQVSCHFAVGFSAFLLLIDRSLYLLHICSLLNICITDIFAFSWLAFQHS